MGIFSTFSCGVRKKDIQRQVETIKGLKDHRGVALGQESLQPHMRDPVSQLTCRHTYFIVK